MPKKRSARKPTKKPDIPLLMVEISLKRGNYADAEVRLRELLRDREPNVDLLLSLGESLSKQGKLSDARDVFLRAIALDGTQRPPYFRLGALYMEAANYSAALDVYRTALKMTPEHEAYSCIGHAYTGMGNHRLAYAAHKRASERAAEYFLPFVLGDIAFSAAQAHKWRAAVKAWRRVLELRPFYFQDLDAERRVYEYALKEVRRLSGEQDWIDLIERVVRDPVLFDLARAIEDPAAPRLPPLRES